MNGDERAAWAARRADQKRELIPLGAERLAAALLDVRGENAKCRRALRLAEAQIAELKKLLLLDEAGRLDLDKIDRLLRDDDTPAGGDVGGPK
ncbi:MAG: hypothetical protein ACQEWM_12195 [Actinomycetota bacterium]